MDQTPCQRYVCLSEVLHCPSASDVCCMKIHVSIMRMHKYVDITFSLLHSAYF